MSFNDSRISIPRSNLACVQHVIHNPTLEEYPFQLISNLLHGESGHEVSKECSEMLADILKKLPSLTYLQSHEEALKKIIGESGQWFLKLEKFEDWKNGKSTAFLALGEPGVGKTCLLSTVISHLQKLQGPTRVAYLYLHHQEAGSQTPINIISVLLRQLLLTYSSLPESVIGLFDKFGLDQGPPQLQTLVTALIGLCKDTNYKTYIVIDALDECKPFYQTELKGILEQLLTNQVQLFATTRPLSEDIESLFNNAYSTKYSIRATASDISGFLKQKLEVRTSLDGVMDEEFKSKVIQTIRAKSLGVFLVAAMQIDHIQSLTSTQKIEEVLSNFPSSLEESFHLTLERIQAQSSDYVELAFMVMTWLVHVHQPLTTKALCYALGTKLRSNRFEVDDLPTPRQWALHRFYNRFLSPFSARVYADAAEIIAQSYF
ncbi:hypothetical protein BDN72DRAFT_883718 [Pluteus cervinus]|uniref:Uncharacterized protein n=1 Tax=Pluteus cervinus TaxID=181527 RepID=A0ACD3A3C7_9AGAR|nr:hypothetical protein BDN72DRAFT_883718 [Pluteus cervinus]